MSVNKIILLGHVGKDPEVRQLESGVKVATFSLATTEKGYTLQNGTQVPDKTEWHNVVLWKGLAETAEKYVKKGDKLYIEGKVRYRSYEDQNKQKRYITEVFGDSMELLGQKPQYQAPPPPEPPMQRPQQYQQQQPSYQQPVQQPQVQHQQPQQMPKPEEFPPYGGLPFDAPPY